MARLTDPDILARYKQALSDWKIEGYVEFDKDAFKGLRRTLNTTVESFKEALFRYVCEEDGEIDQVREQREPWREKWEWRYDLRLTIDGVKVYVETRLWPESLSSREEPRISVVQIKPA